MKEADFLALLIIVSATTVFMAAVGTTIVVNVYAWLRPKGARHTRDPEGGAH